MVAIIKLWITKLRCQPGIRDAVVNVVQKELGDGTSERLKQGLFNITNKKSGIARANASAPWLHL